MSIHQLHFNHVKLELLNPLYRKDLPVEEGFYYVAILNENGEHPWDYYETIITFSGPFAAPDNIEDDDLPYWEGEWWLNDNCITNRGMLREVNGLRKFLVGPKVVTLQELENFRRLLCNELVKESEEFNFYCDGSINGQSYN